MKKFGFTLAEVLITLGIIGVVAALTAPALIQNVGSAQVGPKLAKVVSTIEVANQNLLTQMSADTLLAAGAFGGDGSNEQNYINNLGNYMKITYYDEGNSTTKYASLVKDYTGNSLTEVTYDGILIKEAIKNIGITKDGFYCGIDINKEASDTLKNAFRVSGVKISSSKLMLGTVVIDINGKAEPNRLGKDVFVFELKTDGSLTALGAQNWSSFVSEKQYLWNDGNNKCDDKAVDTGVTCAGSIFENNQKVIYQ